MKKLVSVSIKTIIFFVGWAICVVQEDFIAFEETSYEENYIWNINAEFGNHIICKYSTKMSKPKSNVV